MSTYADIKIDGYEFCCTSDGFKETILDELRVYANHARKIAKPKCIPEVMVALIALDANDYYSFFKRGFLGLGDTFDVTVGPRGGIKIKKRGKEKEVKV